MHASETNLSKVIHICYLYLPQHLFMVCVLIFKGGLRRRTVQAEAQNTLGWLEGNKDDSLSLIAALSEVPEHNGVILASE